MSEIEKTKQNILSQLRGLCAHCATSWGKPHTCPVDQIALHIQSLEGVPLTVNSEFKGMVWVK